MNMITNAHLLDSSKITQKEFDIAQQNIGYAKDVNRNKINVKEIRIQNTSNIIATVNIIIDEFMQREIMSANASYGYENLRSDYYKDRVEPTISTPQDAKGLEKMFAKALNELKAMELDASSQLRRSGALNSLKDLLGSISEKANSLYAMHFELDQNIANEIRDANAIIKSIDSLRKNLLLTQDGAIASNIKSDIYVAFDKLSKYLPVATYMDKDGLPSAVLKTAQNEVNLFDLDTSYYLEYNGISSVGAIKDDQEFSPIKLKKVMIMGQLLPDTELVSGGRSEQVENYMKSGTIAAKVDMAHREIRDVLNMLDQLAFQTKNVINSAHNKGVGYLPAPDLKSTRTVKSEEELNVSGQVKIALVGKNGLPLESEHEAKIKFVPPLIIDFDKLDFGLGIGKARVQDITDLVNRYFDDELSKRKRVEIGDLYDVKLVSNVKDFTPGAPFSLDLELSNYGLLDLGVKIKNCTVTDAAGGVVNVTSQYNQEYISKKGTKERTGISGPRIEFTPTGNYPHSIILDVEVNEGIRKFNAQLKYEIKDPASYTLGLSGLKNYTFSIENVLNPGKSDGKIILPTLGKAALTANLVNKDGVAIDRNDVFQFGRLALSSNSASWRFAIDQADSKVSGNTGNNGLVRDVGFNEFFGLNDLFVRKEKDQNLWHTQRNAALNMKIRDDVASDSTFFSSAKLQKFKSGVEAAPITSMPLYSVSARDNSNLHDILSDLAIKREFREIKTGGVWYGSLSEYSQHIVVSVAGNTRELIQSAKEKNELMNRLHSLSNEKYGISKESEMMDIMTASQSLNYQLSATQKSWQVVENIIKAFSSVVL